MDPPDETLTQVRRDLLGRHPHLAVSPKITSAERAITTMAHRGNAARNPP